MRLIDADKLIDDLGVRDCHKHESQEAYDTLMLYEILGTIDDQPTAYDVDKVCEELETEKSYHWAETFDEATNEIIDIVRRGGVNDIRGSNK